MDSPGTETEPISVELENTAKRRIELSVMGNVQPKLFQKHTSVPSVFGFHTVVGGKSN